MDWRVGDTVLVTGSSSGIGRSLAFEFAKRGCGLVLAGRNSAALAETAAECKSHGASRVLTYEADLGRPTAGTDLLAWLDGQSIEIDVLVNNAGFTEHGSFLETRLDCELTLVQLQINFVLTLTKGLLPKMLKQSRGGLLNVASVYSFAPAPGQAVYGATKAFLWSFGAALGEELRGRGVSVTTICPGVTKTNFRRNAGLVDQGIRGLSPDRVARDGVIAFERGRRTYVSGLANRIFLRLVRWFPMDAGVALVRKINARRGLVHSLKEPHGSTG